MTGVLLLLTWPLISESAAVLFMEDLRMTGIKELKPKNYRLPFALPLELAPLESLPSIELRSVKKAALNRVQAVFDPTYGKFSLRSWPFLDSLPLLIPSFKKPVNRASLFYEAFDEIAATTIAELGVEEVVSILENLMNQHRSVVHTLRELHRLGDDYPLFDVRSSPVDGLPILTEAEAISIVEATLIVIEAAFYRLIQLSSTRETILRGGGRTSEVVTYFHSLTSENLSDEERIDCGFSYFDHQRGREVRTGPSFPFKSLSESILEIENMSKLDYEQLSVLLKASGSNLVLVQSFARSLWFEEARLKENENRKRHIALHDWQQLKLADRLAETVELFALPRALASRSAVEERPGLVRASPSVIGRRTEGDSLSSEDVSANLDPQRVSFQKLLRLWPDLTKHIEEAVLPANLSSSIDEEADKAISREALKVHIDSLSRSEKASLVKKMKTLLNVDQGRKESYFIKLTSCCRVRREANSEFVSSSPRGGTKESSDESSYCLGGFENQDSVLISLSSLGRALLLGLLRELDPLFILQHPFLRFFGERIESQELEGLSKVARVLIEGVCRIE